MLLFQFQMKRMLRLLLMIAFLCEGVFLFFGFVNFERNLISGNLLLVESIVFFNKQERNYAETTLCFLQHKDVALRW